MQLRDALEEALLFVFLVLAVDGSERGKICRVKYGKKKRKKQKNCRSDWHFDFIKHYSFWENLYTSDYPVNALVMLKGKKPLPRYFERTRHKKFYYEKRISLRKPHNNLNMYN
jgi:hypothetical protein